MKQKALYIYHQGRWKFFKLLYNIKTVSKFIPDWYQEYIFLKSQIYKGYRTWRDFWTVFKLKLLAIFASAHTAWSSITKVRNFKFDTIKHDIEFSRNRSESLFWWKRSYAFIYKYEVQKKLENISSLSQALGSGSIIEGEVA